MKRLIGLLGKYREQVSYIFFGGLTTLVNIAAYYVLNTMLGMDTVPAVTVAQVLSVLFAYVTNKLYVFRSHTGNARELLREMGSFFACRAISFFLDIGIMWLSVDVLGWPNMLMKIISNVIIVIVNYVASKLLIFGKGGEASK